MATQHFKYSHFGIDLDTGAEFDVRAFIAVDDDDGGHDDGWHGRAPSVVPGSDAEVDHPRCGCPFILNQG